jgi:signal transduction histidine kinase
MVPNGPGRSRTHKRPDATPTPRSASSTPEPTPEPDHADSGGVRRSRPEQAAAALGHVRHAANTAVEELGTVLGVLRQDGDPDTTTQPAHGLAHLPALLDAMAAGGLRVRFQQSGPVRTLPAAADLAAYRIIQESLTNAHKHGAGGTADLRLAHGGDGVTIETTNPVGASAGGAPAAVPATG